MEPTTTIERRGLNPATRVLLTLAAAVLTVAGLYVARGVIGPLAVAALVVMVAHPLRRPLERRGVPASLATLTVVVAAYLILIIMAALLLVAVVQFVELLPDYSDRLLALQEQLLPLMTQLGLGDGDARAFLAGLSPAQLLGVAAAVSNTVLGAGAAFFFVLAYIVFMAADAASYSSMIRHFAPTKAGIIAALTRFAQSVRKYLLVNTVFGAAVAALDGIVLIALGLPAPLLWVILAFVTNYIPNVGFVIALIPPALLALLTGGWQAALIVVAAYCVINMVMQSFIQPKFVSDAVRLSLTLTFFSVVVWSIVLGPIGAVLAIPATLLMRTLLLESDPDATWARWLTGDQSDHPSQPEPHAPPHPESQTRQLTHSQPRPISPTAEEPRTGRADADNPGTSSPPKPPERTP